MRSWLPIFLLLLSACGEAESSLDASVKDSSGSEDASTIADAGEETNDAATAGMDAAAPDTGELPRTVTLGGDRPAPMTVPYDYDGTPRALVILLHGYSIDGATQNAYFQISSHVDERGFFLLVPDGTREASTAMYRFWNATDACCNFYGSQVDDVAYLLGMIDEAMTMFAIDSVHLIGHSNGGFMAYRMACDAPEVIESVVSLAGATFFDEARCQPGSPVRVLQIHGTADTTILYDGVASGAMRYPGAEETVRRWAAIDACDLSMIEDGPALDLDTGLMGSETDVQTYRTGCSGGIDVELWRLNGAGHVPALSPDFADLVLEWSLQP